MAPTQTATATPTTPTGAGTVVTATPTTPGVSLEPVETQTENIVAGVQAPEQIAVAAVTPAAPSTGSGDDSGNTAMSLALVVGGLLTTGGALTYMGLRMRKR